MLVYDLLSFDKSLPRYRLLSRSDALERSPGLKAAGLRGAALYFDTQIEFAERLVLENVLSATDHSADVRTYMNVDNFICKDARVQGLTFSDHTGKQDTASCRLVINAAGPWVDEVLRRIGADSDVPLIGGTKGSHLVVGPFTGAPADALYVEAGKDQRPIFVIPWLGNYLIGTTDSRQSGSPDDVQIDDWEIEYLLAEVNRLIPSAGLNRESILFTYSGIRPLPYAQSKNENSITRRHFIREHPKVTGLMSLVGGKLSTYRSFAEQTVDLCFQRLGRTAPKCTTAITTLPGAFSSDSEAVTRDLKNESRLSDQTRARLIQLYGARAAGVLRLAQENPNLFEQLDSETSAIGAEVVLAFKEEMATTLVDCLLRRTMVGLNSTRGLEAIEPAALIAQRHLGWSETRARDEILAYRRRSSFT